MDGVHVHTLGRRTLWVSTVQSAGKSFLRGNLAFLGLGVGKASLLSMLAGVLRQYNPSQQSEVQRVQLYEALPLYVMPVTHPSRHSSSGRCSAMCQGLAQSKMLLHPPRRAESPSSRSNGVPLPLLRHGYTDKRLTSFPCDAGRPFRPTADAAEAAVQRAETQRRTAQHADQASSSSGATPSMYPSVKHAEPSAPPAGAMAAGQAEASAPPMPEHVAQVCLSLCIH